MIVGSTAAGNFVQGNYVGLKCVSGKNALSNGKDGITVFSPTNTIGGSADYRAGNAFGLQLQWRHH